MTPVVAADKPAEIFGWPSTPARLFGIAAAFFVVLETILLLAGMLKTTLPVKLHGQFEQVPIAVLWLVVASPFAAFALLYAAIEFKMKRVFEQAPTRIHFVCTLLAVMEAARVYFSWVATTTGPTPGLLDTADFTGTGAFLILALAAFIWNLTSSKPKSLAAR